MSSLERHFSRRVTRSQRPPRGGLGQGETIGLHWGFPFPDSFPTAELGRAAQEAAALDGVWACQYGGGDKARLLGQLIRGRLKERGLTTEDRDLVITNGAAQALDLCGAVFLDPGDLVLVEAPTFMGGLYAFGAHLAEFMTLDMGPQGPLLGQLEEKLEARRREGRPLPKLLYTIPNFHNPTGITMSLEDRERLLGLAREYDFMIVEDDAYGELFFQEPPPPTLQELDPEGRVIYVGTLSKVIAPGIRIGWTLARPEISSQLARLKGDGMTSPFMQSIIAQYWESGDLKERIRWLRESYANRWKAMDGALEDQMPREISWSRPGGGFFIWLDLPQGSSAKRVAQRAQEEGVTVLPGDIFFPPGMARPALRLSFSFCPDQELVRGTRILSGIIREECL